ncbi:MAG: hypothetical protein JWQ11_2798 [Rhizobacter sp.]|nr:hypothetical protein [Rhizobacter sp.]
MFDTDFTAYSYFPTLRTRVAELKGLAQLDSDRKRRILPLLTLGRWPQATDFARAAEKARESMGDLPYFIDLTSDPSHLAEQQMILRNPDNAFEAWRQFIQTQPNAIPIAQLPAGCRMVDVIKQATKMERTAGRLAFRIRDFDAGTTATINAISALDDPANAMVFLDCHYIRGETKANVLASLTAINRLRTEFPEIVNAVLATSFPVSTVPFADGSEQRGLIDIQERDLHTLIGGDRVAAYGDHGSLHAVVYDDRQIMNWSARIDFPQNHVWTFERRPGDRSAEGYASAAKALIEINPGIALSDVWGERMIVQAAGGEPHGRAPSNWISVRVNIHLTRQVDLSSLSTVEPADDDSDDL